MDLELKIEPVTIEVDSYRPLDNKIYDFNSGGSLEEPMANWQDLVTATSNVESRNIQCELFEEGCSTVFTTGTSHIQMQSEANDFKMTAVTNEALGYVYTLCVVCTYVIPSAKGPSMFTSPVKVQQDEWVIIQRADTPNRDDCSDALNAIDWSGQPKHCFKYGEADVEINPNGIQDFYMFNGSSSISTNCPINLCEIRRDSSCSGTDLQDYYDGIRISGA